MQARGRDVVSQDEAEPPLSTRRPAPPRDQAALWHDRRCVFFPEEERPAKPRSRRITFRRFLIGWTLLAVVAWLYFASTGPGEMGCRESDFICFSQREIDLIAAVAVGIPWLLGLVIAGVIVGLVKWRGRLLE